MPEGKKSPSAETCCDPTTAHPPLPLNPKMWIQHSKTQGCSMVQHPKAPHFFCKQLAGRRQQSSALILVPVLAARVVEVGTGRTQGWVLVSCLGKALVAKREGERQCPQGDCSGSGSGAARGERERREERMQRARNGTGSAAAAGAGARAGGGGKERG